MTDDLAERVKQFQSLSLPGQPMMMHMGTADLILDLWCEIERLRGVIEKSMAVPLSMQGKSP